MVVNAGRPSVASGVFPPGRPVSPRKLLGHFMLGASWGPCSGRALNFATTSMWVARRPDPTHVGFWAA